MVRFDVIGTTTPEEIATFTGERAGMTRGWTASFDALEALLVGAASVRSQSH